MPTSEDVRGHGTRAPVAFNGKRIANRVQQLNRLLTCAASIRGRLVMMGTMKYYAFLLR